MIIRLSQSSVGVEEKAALARVIDNGYFGMGDEVRLFEKELGAHFGSGREVVCVATGTAALHLAMAALDIGPGDEVLVPSITYVACFQAVGMTGARPVACDVRSEDAFIDLNDAARRLTQRTRAIMPVHYAGGARGMDEVYTFARDRGLRVIEDAAHSFGCVRNGVQVGAAGDIVCFSFDGIKNITCGEGGAAVTGDAAVAQRMRDARLLGVERDTDNRYAGRRSWTFDVRRQGFRYHMSNMNAAIGREQLKKLPQLAARRRALAARYCRELRGLNAANILDLDWNGLVPHIFVVRVTGGLRDGLKRHLEEQGIESGFHYQPNHTLSLYAGVNLPRADRLAEELLTLPLHANLTDREQTLVISEIWRFLSST